jgi:chromosome segregation ATPase
MIRPAVAGLVIFASSVFVGGCAQILPCTVSPVEIEETREDIQVLEKDLIAARDRARELGQELAAKQAELDSKKDKPAQLRKKVKELKKGSGRDDEDKKDEGKGDADKTDPDASDEDAKDQDEDEE